MNNKEHVLTYLETNRLMALASSHNNKPWAVTVFFAYDTELNLYFYSKPDTEHCKQIDSNNQVAVAIHQNWGEPGLIKGVQLTGICTKPTGEEYTTSFNVYSRCHNWAHTYPDHVIYKIKPVVLYYLDHKLFGHFNRVRVV